MKTRIKTTDTCKIFSLFNILWTFAWILIHFSWFRKITPPIEELHPFSRQWARARMYVLIGRGRRHISICMRTLLPLMLRTLVISVHTHGSSISVRDVMVIYGSNFFCKWHGNPITNYRKANINTIQCTTCCQRWPMDSPHQGPTMREAIQYHVITALRIQLHYIH